MEKMWSPWRSNYIESFKNKKEYQGCVFCNTVNENPEDENSLKVYQGNDFFIVLNLYPYNNGHVMVVPNKHICKLTDLSADEMSEMMRLVKAVVETLTEVMNPQGFNIGANLGKAAGAGIDTHLHFHVVPRWNGDTNFMPALGEVKVISQDLLRTKNSILNTLPKYL